MRVGGWRGILHEADDGDEGTSAAQWNVESFRRSQKLLLLGESGNNSGSLNTL